MSILPVLTKRDLVESLAQGSKAPSFWRIGTEHEKFILSCPGNQRIPYDNSVSIKGFLQGLTQFGWIPVLEKEKIIALRHPQVNASISLEPGGQFELSGAPLATLHETNFELENHFSEVLEVAKDMGACLLPLGFDPKSTRDDVPWMPKGRYELMRSYMPKKGNLGIDMMLRTSTVQVNLDYDSEADMVAKMRVGMALQPIVSALFASSPLTEGKPNGYKSFRSAVWQDTDPDRSGILDFVFDDSMSFERYVDYLLDVPMYFVYRKGRYIDALGHSFSDFMAGELSTFWGQFATQKDWNDHLTVAFPEVRLKRFIEMRGADAGPKPMLMALPAIWVGLLYDRISLDEAQQLIRQWPLSTIHDVYKDGPKQGLFADVGGRLVIDVVRDILAIADGGLKRRHILNRDGNDESVYLAPLFEIADSGQTVADQMLKIYADNNGDVDKVIGAYDICACRD